MLRIVHVVESFGGGVYQVVSALASEQSRTLGHEVHVVYSDRRAEHFDDFRKDFAPGVRFHLLPMARSITVRDPVAAVRLARLLRRIAPGVVHLHSSKAGALGRVAALAAGVRAVVYTPNGLAYLRRDIPRAAGLAYRAIEWLLARLPGTLVGVSASEVEALEQIAPRRRVRLVYNGMALERVLAVEARTHRERGALVGTAGRITAQKGPEAFLQVCRRVLRARPDVRFLWIGDGPDRAMLEADPVVAPRLEITGWQAREASLRRIAELDVYVQTSLWEGLPITVTEAMLLRRPAVVTPVTGNRDAVVHGETGFIAAAADDIAARVVQLLDDAALRERFGSAARALAGERHALQRMVQDYEALYRELPGAR